MRKRAPAMPGNETNVDQISNEARVPEHVTVTPDIGHGALELTDVDADSLAFIARELRRYNVQWEAFAELLRNPQPVWVRQSDSITVSTGATPDMGTPASPTGATPVRLVNGDRATIRNTIRNTGANTLYLCPYDQRSAITGVTAPLLGFPILSGASYVIDSRAAMAAYSIGGTTTFAVLTEQVQL